MHKLPPEPMAYVWRGQFPIAGRYNVCGPLPAAQSLFRHGGETGLSLSRLQLSFWALIYLLVRNREIFNMQRVSEILLARLAFSKCLVAI